MKRRTTVRSHRRKGRFVRSHQRAINVAEKPFLYTLKRKNGKLQYEPKKAKMARYKDICLNCGKATSEGNWVGGSRDNAGFYCYECQKEPDYML